MRQQQQQLQGRHWVFLSFLTWGVVAQAGFVLPTTITTTFCCDTTTVNSSSSSSPRRQQRSCAAIIGRTTTSLGAAQKKSPRFTQQAHKNKSSNSNNNNKKFSNKNKPKKPWDSGKSIDDLEETMMKRWGTLERPKNNNNKKQQQIDMRRSVVDPFGESSPKEELEWYDEDDEGYEIVMEDDDDEEYDDDEDERRAPRLDVGKLISPKPVGGRGTNNNSNNNIIETKKSPPKPAAESYFFNPNKVTTTTTTNGASSKKDKQEEEEKSKRQSKNNAASPSQILLNEDGEPMLLTLDEALHQFQDSVDEDTFEIIESAEVPIAATNNNKMSWEDLGITSEPILENLRDKMGCVKPLSVQSKACPAILTGNDVLVGTYTGSGKTLAFLTPIVEKLLWEEEHQSNQGGSTLIIAPGRELASQTASVARSLVEGTGLKVQLAIGGTTFSRNLEQIRKGKPDIIVGTPGRIAELVVGKPGEKSGRFKINNLQYLVLDEFDALLEYKPHRDPTRAVLSTLKRRHGDALQIILCSATASDVVGKVEEFLRPGYAKCDADDDDVLVTSTNKNRVSKTILHGVVHVPHRRFALDTIRRILHTDPLPQQILIFVDSARKVDIVVDKLGEQGIIAAPLHGGNNSEKMDRAEVSKALREGYVGIVVATEMAARGLDAPMLTHVINLDLPTDASHYAHRAGRCGRGGRPGVVINFTTSPKERKVPQRFTDALGIDLHTVEPRQGKLVLVDPTTQTIDQQS